MTTKSEPAEEVSSALIHSPKSSCKRRELDPPHCRFLDLPTEIRMIVYGCFETLPGAGRDDTVESIERRMVITTRKSLLSVCRQIGDEWAPRLYQIKRFLVNVKIPDGLPGADGPRPWIGHDASEAFGKFLKGLAPVKRQQLRQLEYSLTWYIHFKEKACWKYGQHDDGLKNILYTRTDVEGAQGLGRVLQRAGMLQTLQSVMISAHYNYEVERSDFSDVSPQDYLTRWWSLVTTYPFTNSRFSHRTALERTRQAWQAPGESGVFRDWKVIKRIWVRLTDYPENDIKLVREGKGLQSLSVKKVALEFRKKPIIASGPDEKADEILVILHSCGPLIGTPCEPDYICHYLL